MYSLCGSRVPLNIPHFKNFAATINFYTHPINVPGIFSCHMHISDLCHFLGQAKLAAFLNLAPRLINVFSLFFRYQLKLFGSYDKFQISSNTITATGFIRRYVCLKPGCCCTVPLYHQLSSRCRCNCNSNVGWVDPSTDNVIWTARSRITHKKPNGRQLQTST